MNLDKQDLEKFVEKFVMEHDELFEVVGSEKKMIFTNSNLEKQPLKLLTLDPSYT
ncbi:MAG: hypothetical protein AB1608_02390 [Thermoproteota archaeon]